MSERPGDWERIGLIVGIRDRARRLTQILTPHALVLSYHQVGRQSPDPPHVGVPEALFAAQMEELRRAWNPVSLDGLVDGLAQGSLPRKSVAVTFDDGYASVLSRALPVLRRFQIPAAVFVSTGYLDGKNEFWWDELQRIVWESKTESAQWKGLPEDVRMRFYPGMPRADALEILHDALRSLPPDSILKEMERIRRQARCRPAGPRPDVRPLTARECG